jgi:FtsH-binding integral membrane protein
MTNHKLVSFICFIVIFFYTLGVTLKMEDGKFLWSCQRTNLQLGTFLYILTSIAFIYYIYNIDSNILDSLLPSSLLGGIIWILSLVVLIFGFSSVNTPILKLVLYFSIILLLGISFRVYRTENISNSLLLTLGLVIMLTFLSQFMDFSDGFGKYLFVGLLLLIIGQFISIYLGNITIVSIVGVILFSLFILYDTNKLKKLSCERSNYLDNSLQIFLDILNLFSNIQNLNNN